MPNWVYNYLDVAGDPADITALREAMAKPYETHFPDTKWNDETKVWEKTPAVQQVNPIFSFWNIVSPTNLEAYYGESYKSTESNIFAAIADQTQNGNDWYNWNVRTWGTKWDAGDVEIVYEDDSAIQYKFDTAWSPPIEAINLLAANYPTLSFTLDYEEETGWGGSVLWHHGTMQQSSEYQESDVLTP